MTADVILLASRRRPAHDATCSCPRSQLDALAARTRALLDDTDGVLLVPRQHLEDALADLVATTNRLLPPEQGTKP